MLYGITGYEPRLMKDPTSDLFLFSSYLSGNKTEALFPGRSPRWSTCSPNKDSPQERGAFIPISVQRWKMAPCYNQARRTETDFSR